MPCKHPLYIRNRAYSNPKGSQDVSASNLALRPWDVARQWLVVPCGHCEDCLRRLRNDWFVRIERELAYSKHIESESFFITISIAPKYYDRALADPAWFVRTWFERVRQYTGCSIKHVLFQEFGMDPQIGSEPRLHFHGFLFHADIMYNTLREAIGDLGFIWIGKPTLKRARYVVKYVVKNILIDESYARDKFVTVAGVRRRLDSVLTDSIYTRKFVSAGVGNWIGNRDRPSDVVTTWNYCDWKTGRNFTYAIPRYFDRFRTEEEKIRMAVRMADSYARFSDSSLVRSVVDSCVERWIQGGKGALSFRGSYKWQRQQVIKRLALKSEFKVDPPALLLHIDTGPNILSFWQGEYNICVT